LSSGWTVAKDLEDPFLIEKMARRINFSWRMSTGKTSLLIERNKHIIAILNKYRLMVTSRTSEASLTFPCSTPSILIVLLKFLPVRLNWILLSKQKVINLELRHIEINTSSRAKTVYLAKTWAITHLLTYMYFKTLSVCCLDFNIMPCINLEIQTCSIK